MTDEVREQTPGMTPEQIAEKIDPNAHLHPRMRVIGAQGKQLGKVETLDHDTDSGRLLSLVVRHGMFSNKLTTVSATRVKWVNSDSVILDISPTAFNQLPRLAAN
ncbi:MAG: PRC-barrel domain-containing protein [Nitrolancea sp.]